MGKGSTVHTQYFSKYPPPKVSEHSLSLSNDVSHSERIVNLK